MTLRTTRGVPIKERWLPGLDRTGRPVDTVITYAFRFVLDG
ncbi:MAG: hypothetical protein PHU25_12045 [Deltaproteobacteria bacterium]|nr:hypothetical protein [Deltaproteobacteria bacterium]